MRKLVLFFSILIISNVVFAQSNDNETLVTINNTSVSKSEFERIYKKNNNLKDAPADQKSLDDYMELFINFKLKVLEAQEIKLDTAQSFINELSGYRSQLSKPYLIDKDADENILLEAYERMKSDVRASHILIKLEENALPKDTLIAYNKALKIRKRLLAGEAFDKVAMEVSDDPSAKSNGGDLGFFTAFQMVYQFETVAFGLKIDEVSIPARTQFGYHILKVTDKRDNQGQIKVAHIMVTVPKDSKPEDIEVAKNKILEAYNKLKEGSDFKAIAEQYSDDKGSAKQGGELPWFGTGRMVPEFEVTAFGLKEKGDYSEPVQTSFGWHIIKLIDKKPIGTYEELKTEIKNKIARDARSEKSKKSLVNKLKTEYSYAQNQKNIDEFIKTIDKTFTEGTWKAGTEEKLNKPIFNFANISISQYQFAKYLESNQRKVTESRLNELINSKLDEFIDKSILDYEDSQLEKKYPEFRFLMNEYHDGILLFELTDKMVWSKAVQDSVGLEKFHEAVKDKYMWDKRVNASIYTCPNEKIAEGIRKIAEKRITNGNTYDETVLKFIKVTKNDESLKVLLEDGVFLKGDNVTVDNTNWNLGLSPNYNIKDKVVFVAINKIIEPTPKLLKEAKGLVTADYQSYLEIEWIKTLRAKYSVKVNKELLYTIK
ncbi:MAG: hypothetical protein A2046_10705 [Bacteroidetes bacterium GWA2_30_7]|nr:MAG: hypothetical protein A2046_10705 [Bacteroidetes bacterium GWA2_30_7]